MHQLLLISAILLVGCACAQTIGYLPSKWCDNGLQSSAASTTARYVTVTMLPGFSLGNVVVKSLASCKQACQANGYCRCALFGPEATPYYGGHTCTLLRPSCDYPQLAMKLHTTPPYYYATTSCRTTPTPRTGPPTCIGGPGSYPWPNSVAKLGVSRTYLDPVTNSRISCKCTANLNGKPAGWKCAKAYGNDYNLDYGWAQFHFQNSQMKFSIYPPAPNDKYYFDALGSRIHWYFQAYSATFCADIKTPIVANGSCFSAYVTSGEPRNRTIDKWDELDFEFLTRQNGAVWLNTWHNGVTLPGEAGYRALPFYSNNAFHTYCIDWTTGGQARWYVDGNLFHQYPMTNWTKRMYPTLSFWGQNGPALPGLANWLGHTTYPEPPYPLSAYVQNIAYEIRS